MLFLLTFFRGCSSKYIKSIYRLNFKPLKYYPIFKPNQVFRLQRWFARHKISIFLYFLFLFQFYTKLQRKHYRLLQVLEYTKIKFVHIFIHTLIVVNEA